MLYPSRTGIGEAMVSEAAACLIGVDLFAVLLPASDADEGAWRVVMVGAQGCLAQNRGIAPLDFETILEGASHEDVVDDG